MLLREGEGAMVGDALRVNELVYLGDGRASEGLTLRQGGRAILVGGEPLDEQILLWWNFVGRDKGTIARAQRDWEASAARFGSVRDYDGPSLVAPPLPWPGY